MSNVITIHDVLEEEKVNKQKETNRIANEYLVAGQLHPDEDIKKLVLSTNDKVVNDRISSAYTTAENITPAVAKVVLPGVVANVKILQEANILLANQAEETENELVIVTEQRDVLQSRLDIHENSQDTSHMLDKIRQERETQLRLQPKKSQAHRIRKHLAKAVQKQLC